MKKISLFISIFIMLNVRAQIIHEPEFFENYKMDSEGFRMIDSQLLNNKASKYLIMLGDSNVFGDGLKDAETLPAILSAKNKNYYVYNYGMRGGGPHDTLFYFNFKIDDYKAKFSQKDGVIIYNFYAYLYERVIGAKNYLKWSSRNSPYYQLDSQNKLVYEGRFSDRTFLTGFYRFIIEHKWLDTLLPVLPRIHSRHIKLTAAIFAKMNRIFAKRLPHGRFIVVLNDSYILEPSNIWQNAELEIYLKEYHVEFVRMPVIENFQKMYTFKDGHIKYEGQKLTADFIAKFL